MTTVFPLLQAHFGNHTPKRTGNPVPEMQMPQW